MSVGRKPQASSDYRSVTVLRDGGGDFPTIESAIEYLNVSGFTPTSSDYFTIEIGTGTFTIDNSLGPITLPDFVVLQGQGFSVTNIRGSTPGNNLFAFDACTARNISFGSCAICFDRIATTSGSTYFDQVEFASCTAGVVSDAGFVFVQRCSAQSWSGTLIQHDGGTLAVENCNFVIPANNAEAVETTGGTFSMRSCTVEGALATGTRGIFANQSVANSTCDISGNNWNNMVTAIQIADQANMTFFCKGDKVRGATTDLIIDGAAGTNSATYEISDFSSEPSKWTLNDNIPPTNSVAISDGANFNLKRWTEINSQTTLDQTYRNVGCDGTFTVFLPPAADFPQWDFLIKNIGAGTITVDGDGAETIDGVTTKSLATQYDFIRVQSDGVEWWIVAGNI
jgi:hypothetical protein